MGNLKLFVDIITSSPITVKGDQSFKPQRKKIQNIQPRPPTPIVIRVVVWEVSDIPSEDFEDVSDLYV